MEAFMADPDVDIVTTSTMTTTSTNENESTTKSEEQKQQPSPSPTTAKTTLRKSALQDNIDRKGKNAYYFAHSHKVNGPQWDGKIEPKLLSRHSVVTSSTTGSYSSGCDDLDSNINTNNVEFDALSLVKSSTTSSFDYSTSNITKYAFLDDDSKIKIYIELEQIHEQCTTDDVTLQCTDRSLYLAIQNYYCPKQRLFTSSSTTTTSTTPNQTSNDEKEEIKEEDVVKQQDQDQQERSKKSPSPPLQVLRFRKLAHPIQHENATFRIKPDKVIVTLKKVDPTITWHAIADNKGNNGCTYNNGIIADDSWGDYDHEVV